jgi:secreted trypsin-like serine protease
MHPNPRLNLPRRVLTILLAVCVCAFALVLAASAQQALAASPAGASFDSGSSPLVPYIVGGQKTSIEQVPWQVYVEGGPFEEGGKTFTTSCGGAILSSTQILTAAHCTDVEGTTNAEPDEKYAILAGDSADNAESPTMQIRAVEVIRRDPLYKPSPTSDDVAILTLKTPLELSAAKNAEAISLVPTGATPAPGTPLNISGYGKEAGAEEITSNGELFSTTLTAISSDACRAEVSINSAVLLCAVSASSSTCQGDSGGPLTEGSPAVEVGIVDFGAKECPVGVPDVFTNIAAPEIHAFIEGSEAPPVAARPTSSPAIKSFGATPVDFSPLTCEPGAWSGSPSFTYTFQVENASAQVLQSAPGNIFVPPSTLVGSPLVCIVQASNPGGVTTARSGTTPAIVTDTAPPVASITARKCELQQCTLSIAASDPNAVALTLDSAAAYSVTVKCPRKKKKKGAKRPICHKTKTLPMSVANPSVGVYQASVSRLPYSEKITFTILAANAAGLTQIKPAFAATTLHRPKPKRNSKQPKKRK